MPAEEDMLPELSPEEEEAVRAFNIKLLQAGEGELYDQWEALVTELGGLDYAGEQELLRIVAVHKTTARLFWPHMYEFQRRHAAPDGFFYSQLLDFLPRVHRAKVKKVRKKKEAA